MESKPEDFKQRVWVNEKFLKTYAKKQDKWKPVSPQGRVLWGLCRCGEPLYEGDSVGMYGEHECVVCYSCWLAGALPESHLDCCGLKFPEVTLSQ